MSTKEFRAKMKLLEALKIAQEKSGIFKRYLIRCRMRRIAEDDKLLSMYLTN